MRRHIGFFLFSFVGLLGISWAVHAQDKVLQVGIIASLSGSQARIGQDLRDGALLAIEQINDKWKDGGAEIAARVEDDAAQPDQSKAAANRLMSQKIDLLFGIPDSDCALALVNIISQAQIPVMTLATHAELTEPPQKWIFRANMSDDDQSRILTDYLWDMLLEKKIALLNEDSAYGRSGAEAQRKRIRQYRAEPVAEVSYTRGEKDLTSALEKIQAAGTTGILVYGLASDAQAILTAVRDLKMDAKIMASSGWDTRSVSDLPADLTQGVIVGGYLAFAREDREEIFGPSWGAFAKAFKNRFGREPDVMAAHAYSAMMCVAQAFERVGFQNHKLVEGLERTKAFETLLESLINFDDENRDGVKFIHFTKFQDGKFLVWKRNKMVRELRFQAEGRPISIGQYKGKIYKAPAGITVWMALHYALGRPSFIKDFHIIDEYGLKSCFVGALFRDKTRVPMYRLIFRSEEDATNALNLASFGGEEMPAPVEESLDQQTSYRDTNRGIYTDGTYWAGYKRVGNVLVLASGGIPREDLEQILDAILHE